MLHYLPSFTSKSEKNGHVLGLEKSFFLSPLHHDVYSCLGCAQPGKYLRLGIVKILPTTKSSKKIQF